MVIPRKSYEDLQNELLEKIKQIDELTSRFVVVYNFDCYRFLFFKVAQGQYCNLFSDAFITMM